MTAAILPCPFCGAAAEGPYLLTGRACNWVVSCPACGATLQRYVARAELSEAVRVEVVGLWNARVAHAG